MMTAVEQTNEDIHGRSIITTTLFEVIAALQEDGLDEKAVVPIIERMFAHGRIKFHCHTAVTN